MRMILLNYDYTTHDTRSGGDDGAAVVNERRFRPVFFSPSFSLTRGALPPVDVCAAHGVIIIIMQIRVLLPYRVVYTLYALTGLKRIKVSYARRARRPSQSIIGLARWFSATICYARVYLCCCTVIISRRFGCSPGRERMNKKNKKVKNRQFEVKKKNRNTRMINIIIGIG